MRRRIMASLEQDATWYADKTLKELPDSEFVVAFSEIGDQISAYPDVLVQLLVEHAYIAGTERPK